MVFIAERRRFTNFVILISVLYFILSLSVSFKLLLILTAIDCSDVVFEHNFFKAGNAPKNYRQNSALLQLEQYFQNFSGFTDMGEHWKSKRIIVIISGFSCASIVGDISWC